MVTNERARLAKTLDCRTNFPPPSHPPFFPPPLCRYICHFLSLASSTLWLHSTLEAQILAPDFEILVREDPSRDRQTRGTGTHFLLETGCSLSPYQPTRKRGRLDKSFARVGLLVELSRSKSSRRDACTRPPVGLCFFCWNEQTRRTLVVLPVCCRGVRSRWLRVRGRQERP